MVAMDAIEQEGALEGTLTGQAKIAGEIGQRGELRGEVYATGGSGGTTDYNELDNKPSVNGHELVGDSTLEQLNVYDRDFLNAAFVAYSEEIDKKAAKTYVDAQDEALQTYVDAADDALEVKIGERPTKQYVDNADSALNEGKQNKADPQLTTGDKTIVGAINEIVSNITTHFQDVVRHITAAERTLWNTVTDKVARIDAQSGSAFVYGRKSTEEGGTEGKFSMGSAVASLLVVQRDNKGCIYVHDTPTVDNEAASKSYADLASQKVKKEQTTVDGQLAIILKENNTTATTTGQTYFNTGLWANPAQGAIRAKIFNENGTTLANKYAAKTHNHVVSDITDFPTIPTVPTNVSAFTNDAGYLTLSTLPKYNGEVV